MTVYHNYYGKALSTSPTPTTTMSLPGGTSAKGSLYATQPDTEFWGGNGVDMHGLGGDSLHIVSIYDRVFEAPNDGVNTVYAWQTIYLPKYPNVQNLTVYGTNNAYGSSLDGIISGSGDGMQQLFANGGNDVLIGGTGPDVFIIVKGDGNEVIQNFDPAKGDVVRLTAGFTNFAEVKAHLTQQGSSVLLNLGGGDGLIFHNMTVSQLGAQNFELQLNKAHLGPMTFDEDFNHGLSLYNATNSPHGFWEPDFGADPQSIYDYNINSELECYVSPYFRGAPGNFSINPFSTSNGVLTITAAPSSNPNLFGLRHTSGLITTEHSFSQTYGYYEIRADASPAPGSWSAFWLLPQKGGWPPEADIMENWGSDPNETLSAWHSGANDTNANENQLVPKTASGFHTYGLMWGPQTMTWYIDGVEVWQAATPSDMRQPMYLLANLALTNKDGAVVTPASMKIDYIHVYSIPGVSIPGPTDHTSTTIATKWFFASPTETNIQLTGSISQTVLGNNLGDTITSNNFGSRLLGGSGDDTLIAGTGGDTLTGRGGDDAFVFRALPTKHALITDFTVGQDAIDLSALLAASGYRGSNPGADGYVSLASDGGSGSELLYHPKGSAGGAVYLVDLAGVAPSTPVASLLAANPSTTNATAAANSSDGLAAQSGRAATSAAADRPPSRASDHDVAVPVGSAGSDTFSFPVSPRGAGHGNTFLPGGDAQDLLSAFKAPGDVTHSSANGWLPLLAAARADSGVFFNPHGGPGHGDLPAIIALEHASATSLVPGHDWLF
jgi:beta-glucanase (GH16 family)